MQIAKMRSKIFSTDQIRAIQDGRMTQFMQVVMPQPWPGRGAGFHWSRRGENSPRTKWNTTMETLAAHMALESPFGKVGDTLYCREAWHYWDRPDMYMYKNSDPRDYGFSDFNGISWNSPATMPREAARLFLRITNIRVMRVQELTEQDAIKQAYGSVCDCKNPVVAGACEDCYNTGYNYPSLLDLKELNETLWKANSWMWVIDLTKTDKP